MTRNKQPAAPRADAARNVERILEAGRIALRERGPSVPFYEIAKAAGVGQATLYRHFPNKRALVHAIAEENAHELETAATGNSGDLGFGEVLGVLADQIAENGEIAVLMQAEAGSAWYQNLIGRVIEILDTALERERERGAHVSDLDRADLRLVLQMLGAAVTGDTLAGRHQQGERAVRLLLDGMIR